MLMLNPHFDRPMYNTQIIDFVNKKHMVLEDNGKMLVSQTSFHWYTTGEKGSEKEHQVPKEKSYTLY